MKNPPSLSPTLKTNTYSKASVIKTMIKESYGGQRKAKGCWVLGGRKTRNNKSSGLMAQSAERRAAGENNMANRIWNHLTI